MKGKVSDIADMYNAMYDYFGHRRWWPADTPFEICVGALLTQNTSWKNVEKAIANMKKKKVLSLNGLLSIKVAVLRELIKPSGFYAQKAERLKIFCSFVYDNFKSLENMARVDTDTLRKNLLDVKGIGPETADSMLLYAFGRPVFVVDAYTRRLFSRHGFFDEKTDYDIIRMFFESKLPATAGLYGDYHAQIVETGKMFCRKKALCGECFLNRKKYFKNDSWIA
ncbi:MAG: endonuclease III domain-containing protein [bacterium]|nr:endonuclease III domain-containing protein [bacterium]